MSAGVELPKGWAVGGWLLSGGEKMSKSTGNVVKPLDLVDTVGVDGFRYYVLADTAVRPGRRLHLRGPRRSLQRGPRQQPRQPDGARRHRGDVEVRRHRAGAVGRQPARGRRRRRRRRRHRRVGRRRSRAAPSRRRGSWCGPPTPTSRPTSRGSSTPARRSTPCSVTPSRRCGSSPSSPRRRCPTHGAGDLVAPRPAGVGRSTSGSRPTSRGAATRVACRSPRARRCSRASRRARWTSARGLDSHCHLPRRRGRRRSSPRRRGRRRRRTMITVGCDRASSIEALDVAGPLPRRARHRRAAPPRGPPRRRHDPRPVRRPGAPGRGGRVRPRLPLRPLAARRAAGGVRGAGRAGQRARPAARDPHPRGVGRHVRRPRRRGRAGAHGVPLLHRRPRRGAGVPRPRRATSASPGSSRSTARPRSGRPPRSCRSTARWSRPTARTWRRCPTAASATGRPGCRSSGARVAAVHGRRRVDDVRIVATPNGVRGRAPRLRSAPRAS